MPLWPNRMKMVKQGYQGLTQPVTSTCPSSTWLRRNLRDGARCATHRRASASLEARLGNPSQTCFHVKQAARSQHVSHAIPSSHRFCGAIDKLKPAWFWGPNQESIAVILMPKSPNRSYQFWGPNREILHHLGFEAQPRNCHHRFWGQNREIVATDFEAKSGETVLVVLRPNHSQTVDLCFEAQSRNSRSSSSRARCRPHIAPPDLSIAQPLSTQPVRPSPIFYIGSPTPATILIAACHAARATCTPWDKQTQFSKWTKDKDKTTEPSQIRIQTSASQWLITIKPRNWPLGFSVFA
jgi:hypothetical protein